MLASLGHHEGRKRYLIRVLRWACVLNGSLLAVALAYLAFWLFGDSKHYIDLGQWLEERIKNGLGGAGAVIPRPLIEKLAKHYPYHTIAFIGAIGGYARSHKIAPWTYYRFPDTFNSDVLVPIAVPRGSVR